MSARGTVSKADFFNNDQIRYISCAKYWSTNIAITASVMMKSNLHDIPHVFGGDFARGEFTPGVRGKSCLVIILI